MSSSPFFLLNCPSHFRADPVEALFTEDYFLLWALALGLLLFYPVRQLIWVLYLRRASRVSGEQVDELVQQRLKRRAGFTSAVLCFVFAVLYTRHLFPGSP